MSPKKLHFSNKKWPFWSKCRDHGVSRPMHTSITQFLYLRLRDYYEIGSWKILRDRSPGNLLWDCVFQKWWGTCTHGISTIPLSKIESRKYTTICHANVEGRNFMGPHTKEKYILRIWMNENMLGRQNETWEGSWEEMKVEIM